MKDKITLFLITSSLALPSWALIDDAVNDLPEPSTIALFASAALAVVLAKKFRR